MSVCVCVVGWGADGTRSAAPSCTLQNRMCEDWIKELLICCRWPLDQTVLVTEVTKRQPSSVDAPAKDGAFMHGYCLTSSSPYPAPLLP